MATVDDYIADEIRKRGAQPERAEYLNAQVASGQHRRYGIQR